MPVTPFDDGSGPAVPEPPPERGEIGTRSLGETLDLVIERLPAGDVTVGNIRDLLGEDSLLILAALLTIVFLVPVSIPGVSTVFGTVILLIAVSRTVKRSLWIPNWVAQRQLSADKIKAALTQGARWLHRLEKISRPRRISVLVSGAGANTVNNVVMIACTLLLMIPLGLVPFTNTLPAMALLMLFVGLVQKDGLCVLGGYLFAVATGAYFTFLAMGGNVIVQHLINQLFRYGS